MPTVDRASVYRKNALDAESKAFVARTDDTRRAWLIVAREWTKMAERETAKAETPDSDVDTKLSQ
jgi:hypothetical protein